MAASAGESNARGVSQSDRSPGDARRHTQLLEDLRQSRQWLAYALAAGRMGTWEWHIDTQRVVWSPGLEQIHGREPGSFQGTFGDVLADVHPDDRERLVHTIHRAMDDRSDYHTTYRIITAAGEERWLEARGAVVLDDQGRPARMVGVCQDVTARQRAEHALRQSEQRFRHMADHAPVMIWVSGTDKRCTWFNQPWLEFVGQAMDQQLGDGWARGVHPDDLNRCLKTYSDAFDARRPFTMEYRLRRHDGAYRWLMDNGTPTCDADGNFTGYIGSCLDITAHKRAEADLEFQKFALDQASIVAITDVAGAITYVNDTFCRISGYSREELIGQNHRILNSGLHPRSFFRELYRTISRGNVWRGEIRNRRKDGSFYWVDTTIVPSLDGRGRPDRYVAIRTDITQRKRAEQAIRESEEKFRALADNMSQFAWMADRNGWIFWYNRRWFEYTGTTLDEMQGWGWTKVHHPDHASRVLAKFKDCIESGRPWEDTFPLRGVDDRYRWFLSRATPLRDDRGRIVRWFGTNTDITEQREAEAALRESEARFAQFMRHLPGLAWIKDAGGRYVFVNDAAERAFQKSRDQLYGRTDEQVFDAETAARFQDNDRRAIEAGIGIETVETLPHADGVTHHSLVSKFPIPDPHGGPTLVAGMAIDITDRIHAQAALQQARDSLEARVVERTAQLRALTLELTQAEQRERKRLAQVLHDDIQQLLAAARMQVDLIGRKSSHAAALEQVGRVIDETIAACRELTVRLSPPVLRDGDIATALRWLARRMDEQHALDVEVRPAAGVPALPLDLRQLIFEITRELLFNVVKHADADRAVVRFGGEDDHIVVEVIDDGQGCEPARLERPSRESFGLFSIRERLRDLGGRLMAEASPGRGCRVRVSVPVSPQQAPDPAEPVAPIAPADRAAPGNQVLRVLLADDHAILRQGLVELLAVQPDTLVVAQASDGHEAVDLARKYQPDVVVMDINMPKLSGVDATRMIRAEMPHVRVIGLSMHDHEDMANAMRQAGAESFLSKGGPVEHLLAALRGQR